MFLEHIKACLLILVLLTLGACSKNIRINCPRPPKPHCAPVVEEFKAMVAKVPPELRSPTPHEFLDVLECVELWESTL